MCATLNPSTGNKGWNLRRLAHILVKVWSLDSWREESLKGKSETTLPNLRVLERNSITNCILQIAPAKSPKLLARGYEEML